MKKTIFLTKSQELEKQDLKSWRSMSPEERLNELELLRIQAGKFLYEYPTRFRRIIRVISKSDLIKNKSATKRTEDNLDVEKLTEN
ncbi:MAG: hypothetical protein P9L89_09085 [Candidatus Celaenobacter polaris]|nr:hypothetical protein [Candidatus Celaenobacter polaris]